MEVLVSWRPSVSGVLGHFYLKHMSAASQALWQANTEGLWLERSEGKSTYRCVTVDSGNRRKPFKAKVRGRTLGMFATAEEAALCSARASAQDSRRRCCELAGAVRAGLPFGSRRRVICAFMALALTAVLLQVVLVVVLLTRPEQQEPELLIEVSEKSVASSPMDGAVASYSGDKMGLTLLTGTPIIGCWLALSMRPSYVPY